MSGTLALITGILIICGAVYLLVKQYETRMVLIGAGFLMAILALNPIAALQAFSTSMVSSGLIQSICSVLGFAFVMKLTEVDKHLIHFLAKGLLKVKPIVIPCAAVATFLVNISLTSAAGVSAAVGAILIPLLISIGVAPATAASAVMLGTFGSMLSPGLAHNPMIAGIAGIEVMEVINILFVPTVASVLIGAISLNIVAIIRKEHTGYSDPEFTSMSDTDFKVNPLFAILPLLPVIVLVILGQSEVRAALPWAKSIAVPHAMLIGGFICMAATRTSPTEATNKFFDGMGKGYGDIIGIIVAAGVFVAGMRTLGMIDAFIEALKNSEAIVNIAASFGPFVLGVLCGSGDAAAIAFNESVTPHAEMFGVAIADMGAMAALAGSLGRTMSPIAGAAIICASIAKVNPFEIAKRNAPGMLIALIASMILLLYM